jgi:phage-related protein
MKQNCDFKLIMDGVRFQIFCMEMGQDCDFYYKLKEFENNGDYYLIDKSQAIIERTALNGPGHNKQKWNKLAPGLYEMKADQARMPFYYPEKVPGVIIITHLFIKKKQSAPKDEIERAKKRMKLGNEIFTFDYIN